MSLRAKLLIIFIAFALAPALINGVVNYRSGTRAVETLLRAEADERAASVSRSVAATVAAHEQRLVELASAPSLRAYVSDSQTTGGAASNSKPEAPETLRAHFIAFFNGSRGHFQTITCLAAGGGALFRVSAGPGGEPRFETEDLPATKTRYDERVWQAARVEPLRSPLAQEPYGVSSRTTVPIFANAGDGRAAGALVLEMKLKEALAEAFGKGDQSDTAQASGAEGMSARPPLTVVALDNASGRVVFHTNDALKYQPVSSAMPYFESIAAKMRAGAEGHGFYDAPDGDRWLAAFRQVAGLGLSLAVARNESAAAEGLRRAGTLGLAAPLLAGGAGLILLFLVTGRTTRRIEEVAAGASAIAAGDLDQRIEVRSTDETRALAESFNQMSDRLRELIRREAESKQFESFMRLSAMLTHDLKNAITGLSMLVSNMEKHLHREEFRADAIYSLREATDKLKRIVSRLNEPVKSLSGEYRRDARATDLIPIIRRVLAMSAEPSVPLYELDIRLPPTLVAIVEPERIENVVENLVINALEAMGANGGRLTVEAGRESESLVYFSVADTGAGMNEDFIKLRLFRPFATTKQKGIGLGLYTCREIVEAHGGRLEVESKLEAGTRFRVVLPSRLFASGERSSRSSEGTVGRAGPV
jgi:signal transduction histidine kinase